MGVLLQTKVSNNNDKYVFSTLLSHGKYLLAMNICM